MKEATEGDTVQCNMFDLMSSVFGNKSRPETLAMLNPEFSVKATDQPICF